MNNVNDNSANEVVAKRVVPNRTERTETVSKNFSTFKVKLSRDAIGKKKLSNKLIITIPDSRSLSEIKMTVREATALRNFLNKNLPLEE